MVNWLSGRRIRGLSSERTGTMWADKVGGWKELGRTTLGSAGDTITVSSLANKRYLMVLGHKIPTGGNTDVNLRYNSDLELHYSSRYSDNGGGDGTQISQNKTIHTVSGSTPEFMVGHIANYSSKEKLSISQGVTQSTAGAGAAPSRREAVGKWANTSSAINAISMINVDAGDYNTNSELVVLGWDPSDTHSTNFWQELANVELGSNGLTLSTGTFTAKKYLWVQIYLAGLETASAARVYFNNSTTSTQYALRYSANGGADSPTANRGHWDINITENLTEPLFTNMFIVNNGSNEALGIYHTVKQSTAGAGYAPTREEFVAKYTPTTQITRIDLQQNSGTINMLAGSRIVVWGSD